MPKISGENPKYLFARLLDMFCIYPVLELSNKRCPRFLGTKSEIIYLHISSPRALNEIRRHRLGNKVVISGIYVLAVL